MTTASLPPTTPVPEAVPAPLLSPALVPRVLFPAARACYGAALLCAPGLALGLCTGRAASQRARAVVRILGARHLAQAALTLWRPSPAVLLSGAGIDACHAASMLALAVADPQLRTAGIADCAAATAFTATGALTGAGARAAASAAVASARPPGQPGESRGRWGTPPPRRPRRTQATSAAHHAGC